MVGLLGSSIWRLPEGGLIWLVYSEGFVKGKARTRALWNQWGKGVISIPQIVCWINFIFEKIIYFE
jgi:hypothetical protein